MRKRSSNSKVALHPWIQGYLSYLREVRRAAPRTVTDVRCTLKRTVAEMSTIRPDTELWRCGLKDFVCWVDRGRNQGRSSASLNKDLSHLRGLLEYSWRAGRADRNVLDGFQLADAEPRTPSRVLTLEETKRLVAACGRRSFGERRDRTMILLLYGCGLRTSELCGLNVQDIDLERQELFVRGKGDRERRIPVPDGVWTELLAYVLECKRKRGPLFRTATKHTRVSSHTACEVVASATRRAGITDKVTPKTLRHTFATHLMDRGADVAVIASLMGHRSPSETGVYLHALPGKREEAVQTVSCDTEDER